MNKNKALCVINFFCLLLCASFCFYKQKPEKECYVYYIYHKKFKCHYPKFKKKNTDMSWKATTI